MQFNMHQAFFATSGPDYLMIPVKLLLGARILAGVQKPEGKAHDPFLLDSAISYSYL
jgi:hypothetical protein